MDLSVLTVSWNSAEYISEQIESVKLACKGLEYEHLIADNGSTDKTVELISKKENVKIKIFKKNIGFGAANNELYKLSSGKFLLLLNPDMKMEEGSMVKLTDWLNGQSKCGLLSCKLVDENGKFNINTAPRRFPKIYDQMIILLKLHHLFPSLLNNYLYRDFDESKDQVVDSVQGSFMLLRREVAEKLGYIFDPRYFIWFEDVDLCREVKKLGYEVWYTSLVSCVDYGGKSFGKRKLYWKQKQLTKSMLSYFKKWENPRSWIWIAVFRPLVTFFARIHDIFV